MNKSENGQGISVSDKTNGTPPGIHKLNKHLQRKFARGVNYNLKIVIKGDARVGKTSLFHRLMGHPFQDEYMPTENLSVTSIDWNYKATDDIVKIDIWEAVDSTSKKNIDYIDLKSDKKYDSSDQANTLSADPNCDDARTSSNSNSLKDEPTKRSSFEAGESLNVYRGTDAVLLVLDMTKLWTFKYVQSELLKVPKHIPVLVIANHKDQGHHRTVSPEQVKSFIEGLKRDPCDGIIMYSEASMKNGFGLKLIEKFFNIPFLRLQEATLLKQLELNRSDFITTVEELQIMQESVNREYEQYLEIETLRRRQQADAMSPVNSGLRQLDELTREQIRNETMSSDKLDTNKTSIKSLESNSKNDVQQSEARRIASQNFVNDRLPSIVIGAKCPLPETKSIQLIAQSSSNQALNQGINRELEKAADTSEESEEEDEVPRANPLVAGYQSDVDSDDRLSVGAHESKNDP